MPRQSGYRVTITGFLPVDTKNIMSQKEALDALTSGYAGLVEKLHNPMVDQRMTSREINDAGEPVPRALRKPRSVNGDKKRKAA